MVDADRVAVPLVRARGDDRPRPGGVDGGPTSLRHVVVHVVRRAVAAADHRVVAETATLGVAAGERVRPFAIRLRCVGPWVLRRGGGLTCDLEGDRYERGNGKADN